MINGNKVIDAWFTDERETDVTVFLERPDGKGTSTIIQCGEQYPEYLDLLKQTTLENIRKRTVERQEFERDAILSYAKTVFEEETIEIEANMIKKLTVTDDSVKDFAFKIKLAMFEFDEVKNASTEQKKAIRQAASPFEALYLAAKLVYANEELSEE